MLAASGLVAGEGLAGVVVAGLVAVGVAPKAMDPRLGGLAGEAGRASGRPRGLRLSLPRRAQASAQERLGALRE